MRRAKWILSLTMDGHTVEREVSRETFSEVAADPDGWGRIVGLHLDEAIVRWVDDNAAETVKGLKP